MTAVPVQSLEQLHDHRLGLRWLVFLDCLQYSAERMVHSPQAPHATESLQKAARVLRDAGKTFWFERLSTACVLGMTEQPAKLG